MTRWFAFLLTVALSAGAAAGQPLEIPLGAGSGDQWNSVACTDGAGGAFIAWLDRRDGVQTDVWLQRIDHMGEIAPGWPAAGVPVCNAVGDQVAPCIASDGAGGAFVGWEDGRAGGADLRIQYITAAGAVAAGWPDNGLVLCAAPGLQLEPVLTTDQHGGVFAASSDFRSGQAQVYAHHVKPAGRDPAWPEDGWQVCDAMGAQRSPAIASNARGGALVAWEDGRRGDVDVYAAQFDSARARPWGASGRALCSLNGQQRRVRATSDGTGGGYFVWEDARGVNYDLYALRVPVSGELEFPWAEDGLPLCAQAGAQFEPQLAPDGAGGLLVAWFDSRAGHGSDIYAVRIDARADPRAGWQTAGTPVCRAPGDQTQPVLAGDGRGGAWIAWADGRGATQDIALQHMDGSGVRTACWPENGVVIAGAAHDQEHPVLVGGAATAICAWTDLRSNTDGDVYARRVHESLPTGPVDPHAVAVCVQSGAQELGPVAAAAQTVVSDGAGGVWLVWEDGRNAATAPDLYLQHLGADAHPVPGWPADGVALCTAPGAQQTAVLAVDGRGGCFAAWVDAREGGAAWRVFLQHLDASGAPAPSWPSGGVRVTDGVALQLAPVLAVDPLGAAWVVWQQRRSSDFDIVLQATAPSGVLDLDLQFPGQGLTLCNAPLDQVAPQLVPAADGVTVAWWDARNGVDVDLYALGVRSTGALRSGWVGNGSALCNAPGDQFGAALAADGAGAIVLAWRDRRNGQDRVYAGRWSESGALAPGWAPNGNVLSPAGAARDVRIAADGVGGTLVAWTAEENGRPHIEITRRTAAGAAPSGWSAVPVRVSGGGVAFAPSLASDGHHGALLTWCDARGPAPAIYAQRIRDDGGLEGAAGGERICAVPALQRTAGLAADATGCAIVVWSDARGGEEDLYANPVRIFPAGLASGREFARQTSGPVARTVALGVTASARGVQLRFARPPQHSVDVDVFDVRGRRIEAWRSAPCEGGCALSWTQGVRPAAGAYFVRVRTVAAEWNTKVLWR